LISNGPSPALLHRPPSAGSIEISLQRAHSPARAERDITPARVDPEIVRILRRAAQADIDPRRVLAALGLPLTVLDQIQASGEQTGVRRRDPVHSESLERVDRSSLVHGPGVEGTSARRNGSD
jgi:hypothetical protein